MVVFGGYGGAYLNDVWALSLADPPTWTQLIPSGAPPAGRTGPFAVYDAVRERLIIHSGRTLGATSSGYLRDVWALSLAGAPAWTPLTPSGGLPRGRERGVAVYDALRDRMIITTGMRSDVFESLIPINDSWALSWNTVLDVPHPPVREPLSMGIPRPNPAQHGVSVAFTSPRSGSWEMRIYDLAGRRLWRRDLGSLPAGRPTADWNLRAEGDARVSPGVYFLELATDNGESARRRFVVLR
jgi:hypothetical protein